jgi:Ca2+-binding RTX toxin-like protein
MAEIFINEFHYDDSTAAGDTGERIEVIVPTGTVLSDYSIVLYNGTSNPAAAVTYGTATLLSTGLSTDLGNGLTAVFVSYPTNGIQNGGSDGIALIGPGSSVVEFLSYEGVITASNGPAAGRTSVDVGVSETNATAPGTSLQRTGTGSDSTQFTFAPSQTATFGSANTGQTLIAAIAGDETSNSLSGTAANDVLRGRGGDDVLAGSAGNDLLDGGADSDTVNYSGFTEVVTVNLNVTAAQAVTATKSDTLTSIENAIGGILADRLTGTSAANVLTGGDGDDVLAGGGGDDVLEGGDGADALFGGLGVDTMRGGLGNDSYQVNDVGDIVDETGGSGIDGVKAFVDYVLPEGIERLILAGVAAVGTGNALDNTLIGRAAADTLSGMDGNDVITGGLGRDVMTGGAGFDTFVFNTLQDSVIATSRSDRITDFSLADGDNIYLVAIDANTLNGAGDDAFSFIGGAGFTVGVAGQLRSFYNSFLQAQVVQGEVNGDGVADFQILVESAVPIFFDVADNFFL